MEAQVIKIVQPNGSTRLFHHRGTAADLGVINQIFKSQDYSLARLRRGQELHSIGRSVTNTLILDAGANIGASVCYFAMHYPSALIVAFEPDDDNFSLLQLNTDGLNVELHKAALGSSDGMVSLVDPGQGEWGYRTEPSAHGDIPLVCINRLVEQKLAAGYSPFIAKIDIEGGEANLFLTPTGWVDEFPLIVVELHDWLLPGQGTSRSFLKCVAERNRDFVHIGENIFSIRN